MTNQIRTIVGAIEYTLATIQGLKKDISQVGDPNHELNWAIAGVVSALSSEVIRVILDEFKLASESGGGKSTDIIEAARIRFNNFVDNMLANSYP